MAAIKVRIAKLLERLTSDQAQLAKARKRYKAARRREDKYKGHAKKAEALADKLRARGGYGIGAAELQDHKAARFRRKGDRDHDRAIYWRGKIKNCVKRIHKLDELQKKAEAEEAKWRKDHGVVIEGNRVVGGNPRKRWVTACTTSVQNCSTGKRRNFYSQAGSWDVEHEISPGPAYGERSDCSQYVTGMAWSAGVPDPNGAAFTGGFTGTLVGQYNGWKRVSETSMKAHGWGYVVYGGGTGHHVEAYIGPGERTAGHGSPPVDYGVIDLFGDSDYDCYVYDPKQ